MAFAVTASAASKPTGVPYSEEIAERICDRLMDGESLRRICADVGMPNRGTVNRWLENNDDFAKRYRFARDRQADLMDDMVIELINDITPETANADRVKLAALQWRASKLAPKKYGDKVTNEHTGPDGESLTVRWEDGKTPQEQSLHRAKAMLALISRAEADATPDPRTERPAGHGGPIMLTFQPGDAGDVGGDDA